jgi:putative transposase
MLLNGFWSKVFGNIFIAQSIKAVRQLTFYLLTAKRDKSATMRFFDKAMQANGIPEKVTMDKSGANESAIDEINDAMDVPMLIRQMKYLNNIVEQDHRAVTRITK